jgi:hypothetical protein
MFCNTAAFVKAAWYFCPHSLQLPCYDKKDNSMKALLIRYHDYLQARLTWQDLICGMLLGALLIVGGLLDILRPLTP